MSWAESKEAGLEAGQGRGKFSGRKNVLRRLELYAQAPAANLKTMAGF